MNVDGAQGFLAVAIQTAHEHIEKLADKYPHLAIFASAAGLTGSLLSAVNVLSVLIGFIGAVFGAVAGYYAMRSARRKWLKQKAKDEETEL